MTDDQIAGPARKRRWLRRGLGCFGVLVVLLIIAFFLVGGPQLVGAMRGPSTPFDQMPPPPVPDYAKADTWLALPGRPGQERSTTPGVKPIDDEAQAPVDVFFIQPTTFKPNDVWNAPYNAPLATAPLEPPVLLEQASVFNGCCRIYAPHYRQASLAGLQNQKAFDLAYGDIAAAFRYYIAHYNHGRPFILASHSQGTGHSIRLLQAEILGTPIKDRMVAAYLIGGYIPDSFAELGLPACDAPTQTGCIVSYNTSQAGRSGARMIIDNKHYWWRGKVIDGPANAVCVNPLNWRRVGAAPASANQGSMPFPKPPFHDGPGTLAALVPHLTGAACRNGLLEVDIPWGAPSGFHDRLSFLFGSYHLGDYGIFYANLRRNAQDRVAAWMARSGGGK